MDSGETLDLLELAGRPSCLDCLAWSPDGELAVAIGDAVHILTPKQDMNILDSHKTITGHRQWHTTKITVNVFPTEEWPYVTHDTFSKFCIGEEQSLSHVIALSWSPAGAAIHRRSLLAVLTSNLVLSLWETNGEVGKWKRVCVVNGALESFFGPSMDESDSIRHKKVIYSFSWSPSYKNPQDSHAGIQKSVPSIWGTFHLAVSNLDNEVIFLRVDEAPDSYGFRNGYALEVVTRCRLPHEGILKNGSEAASLFSSSLMENSSIEHISWGPWLTTNDFQESTSLIAVFYAAKLEFIELRLQAGELKSLEAREDSPVRSRMINYVISGSNSIDKFYNPPALWHYMPGDRRIALAITANDSPTVLLFEPGRYASSDLDRQVAILELGESSDMNFRMRTRFGQTMLMRWTQGSPEQGFNGAIRNKVQLPCLHVLSCFAEGASFEVDVKSHKTRRLPIIPWGKQTEETNRRSSLKHRSEGNTYVKAWGLDINKSQVAACISVHPSDMLEFLTAAHEQCSIAFGTDGNYTATTDSQLIISVEDRQKEIVEWIGKFPEGDVGIHPLDKTIRRVAAQYIAQSKTLKGKVNRGSNLDNPTAEPSERCQICASAIVPGSFAEAACEVGHEFTRCNISFISIQEPGISKYCSQCGKQAIDIEKMKATVGQELDSAKAPLDGKQIRKSLTWQLFNQFDTCPYCGGKFKG